MNNESAAQEIIWHEIDKLDLKTGVKTRIPFACGFNRTDSGNAQRLIALYGDIIRYCVNEKTWYIYDEIGEHGGLWAIDDRNKINAFANNVVNLIHAEVAVKEGDNRKDTRAKRRELTKWAFQSESLSRIKSMVELAQSDPRVTITSDDFNKEPWLLNCPNGAIDLFKRELRDARKEDLITFMVSVPYEPDTISREWYERLIEVLGLEKSAFLQRAGGSALTGINRDKALFAFYGGPNSRKSTLMDAIFETMGTYSDAVDISTFTKGSYKGGGARSDIIDLEKVRAAQCSEIPEDMVFNDAFLKSMTAGNPKKARGLFEKHGRKIKPITKFFIEMNFLPKLNFKDEASFNRFYIITFLNSIPLKDCDPRIMEFLKEDKDAQKAILAWLIQGCYDWQDSGLLPPDSVNAARIEYQKSMNPLAWFVKDECIIDEKSETSTAELWTRFIAIATPEDLKEVKGKSSFGQYLTKYGFETIHKESGNVRACVRLRTIDDIEPLPAEGLKDKGVSGRQSPCNIIEYYSTVASIGVYPSVLQEFNDDLDEALSLNDTEELDE
jgi:putative DNA primase/helicase